MIQTGTDGVEAAIANLTDPNRQKKFPTDQEVAEAIKKASKTDSSHIDAVKTFGLACGKGKLKFQSIAGSFCLEKIFVFYSMSPPAIMIEIFIP